MMALGVINLRWVLLIPAAYGLILLGSYLTDPDVPAVAPPASLTSPPDALSGVANDVQSRDFVSRPLFRKDRRPVLSDGQVVVHTSEVEAVGSIDGVTLLGVFAAGDHEGVIIEARGERQRLLVGGNYDGWRLVAVEPRAARFEASASQGVETALLEMEMASSLAIDYANEESVGLDGKEADAEDDNKPRVPTFDAIYERKAKAKRAQQGAKDDE